MLSGLWNAPDHPGVRLADLRDEVAYLDALPGPMPAVGHRSAFHH